MNKEQREMILRNAMIDVRCEAASIVNVLEVLPQATRLSVELAPLSELVEHFTFNFPAYAKPNAPSAYYPTSVTVQYENHGYRLSVAGDYYHEHYAIVGATPREVRGLLVDLARGYASELHGIILRPRERQKV